MAQRNALLISVVITAFLLVMAGGVAARVSAIPVAAAAEAATATVAPTDVLPTAAPTIDAAAAIQSAANLRMLAYKDTIDAANAKLAEAYATQQKLTAQLAASHRASYQAAPTQAPAMPNYPITPDMATTIAVNAGYGGHMTRGPELVLFQGTVAYEVLFDSGVVYVDANTGAVLFNNAVVFAGSSASSAPSAPSAPPVAQAAPPTTGGGGGGGEGGGDDGGGHHRGGG